MRMALWHLGGLGDVVDAAHLAVALRRAYQPDHLACYVRNLEQIDLLFCLRYDGAPIFDRVLLTTLPWADGVLHEAPRWDVFVDWRPYVASFYERLGDFPRSDDVVMVRTNPLRKPWLRAYNAPRSLYCAQFLDSYALPVHQIACRALGIDTAPIGSLHLAPPRDRHPALRLLERLSYITLATGSDAQTNARTPQTKEWRPEKWRTLVAAIRKSHPHLPILQVGLRDEDYIPGAINLLGRTSIPRLLRILSGSMLHLCCENGTARMARVAGTQSVVLYGPTSPQLFGLQGNIAITSKACEPCFMRTPSWATQCRYDWDSECLNGINPSAVAHVVTKTLEPKVVAAMPTQANVVAQRPRLRRKAPVTAALSHMGGLGDLCDGAIIGAAIREQEHPDRLVAYHETIRGETSADLMCAFRYQGRPLYDAIIPWGDFHFAEVLERDGHKWPLFYDWRPYAGMVYRFGRPVSGFDDSTYARMYREPLSDAIHDAARMKKSNRDMGFETLGLTPVSPTIVTIDMPAAYAVPRYPYISICNGVDPYASPFGVSVKQYPIDLWARAVSLISARLPGVRLLQLGLSHEAPIPGTENLLGRTSFWNYLALLQGSRIHIATEGGSVRLAHLLGTRSVVLFGPTPVHMFALPGNWDVRSTVCEPCIWASSAWLTNCHAKRSCACLRELPPSTIADAALEAFHAPEMETSHA